MTYKAAVQHWERQMSSAAGSVPSVIQACEGDSMTKEEFWRLRNDPTFLYRCANVCESCCLDHNETVLAGLSYDNVDASSGKLPRS